MCFLFCWNIKKYLALCEYILANVVTALWEQLQGMFTHFFFFFNFFVSQVSPRFTIRKTFFTSSEWQAGVRRYARDRRGVFAAPVARRYGSWRSHGPLVSESIEMLETPARDPR